MRSAWLSILCLLTGFVPLACVDPLDITIHSRVDVIVVDGSITNLNEPQVIHLNQSKSDSVTGRFGTLPITGATVEILVDSSKAVLLTETEAGRYQAPSGFKGEVNHSYQLRFTLKEGVVYQSSPEVMPVVPAIQRVYQQFN